MIIGISSILYSFYDLFLDMLKTTRNQLLKNNPIPVPVTTNQGGLSTMYAHMFSTGIEVPVLKEAPVLNAIEDAKDITTSEEYQVSYDHVDTSAPKKMMCLNHVRSHSL